MFSLRENPGTKNVTGRCQPLWSCWPYRWRWAVKANRVICGPAANNDHELYTRRATLPRRCNHGKSGKILACSRNTINKSNQCKPHLSPGTKKNWQNGSWRRNSLTSETYYHHCLVLLNPLSLISSRYPKTHIVNSGTLSPQLPTCVSLSAWLIFSHTVQSLSKWAWITTICPGFITTLT